MNMYHITDPVVSKQVLPPVLFMMKDAISGTLSSGPTPLPLMITLRRKFQMKY